MTWEAIFGMKMEFYSGSRAVLTARESVPGNKVIQASLFVSVQGYEVSVRGSLQKYTLRWGAQISGLQRWTELLFHKQAIIKNNTPMEAKVIAWCQWFDFRGVYRQNYSFYLILCHFCNLCFETSSQPANLLFSALNSTPEADLHVYSLMMNVFEGSKALLACCFVCVNMSPQAWLFNFSNSFEGWSLPVTSARVTVILRFGWVDSSVPVRLYDSVLASADAFAC